MCASRVCVGESPLDLSVSAQRPVCVIQTHSGIMGDEVKGQGQPHTTVCIVCEYMRVCCRSDETVSSGRALCTEHQACDGRCSRGI